MVKSKIRRTTDGFDKPYIRVVHPEPESPIGDDKPETGSPEPERTVEGSIGDAPAKPAEREYTVSAFDVEQFHADQRDSGGDDGATDAGSDAPGRRRGRPPGSGTKKAPSLQNSLKDIETLLFSVHLMGANILTVPELAINPEEAKRMGDAIKEVAVHYPIGLDPKKLALANLAFVLGGVYVPRIVAVVNRPRPFQPARPNPVPQARPMPPVNGPQAVPPRAVPTEERKLDTMAPSDLFGPGWQGG